MKFNADKCQVIRFTNKRSPAKHGYILHGQPLEEVTSAKYLGLNLDPKLNWNGHVAATCKKANRTRAFIQRNTYHCPQAIREMCYHTFIRPTLEYASPNWDPSTQKSAKQLESIQRRCARYVTREYAQTTSVTGLLEDLGWPTLQQRRAQARVILLYRIVYRLVDINPDLYLTPAASNTTRGHDKRYQIPQSTILAHQHSFFPRTVRTWNQLPQSLIHAPTIEAFRLGLSGVLLA